MKQIFLLVLLLISVKANAQFFKLGAGQIKHDATIGENLSDQLYVDTSNTALINWVAGLAGGGSGSVAWGVITGTLSNQTDLQTALNAKQNTITTGTVLQYFRGDLSLATFPTLVSAFTNDAGYLTAASIAGKLNISDTAAMLGNYITEYESNLNYYPLGSNPASYLTAASITGKLNISDTASMLSPYLRQLRTLTINGVTQDLTADRTWNVGTVTSVSGTADRITSTGGTTPVIDISATFEALLGKVANRIDQNNAATTSAEFAGVISDETGTAGTLVYSSGPTLTNPIVGTQAADDNSTKAASTAYVDSRFTGMITFATNTFNPADNATLYTGGLSPQVPGTATTRKIYFTHACTITGVVLNPFVSVASSAQDAQFYVRLNNTTDYTITLTAQLTAAGVMNVFGNTSMIVPITTPGPAGDFIEIKMVFPAYTTNPTGVFMQGTIGFK